MAKRKMQPRKAPKIPPQSVEEDEPVPPDEVDLATDEEAEEEAAAPVLKPLRVVKDGRVVSFGRGLAVPRLAPVDFDAGTAVRKVSKAKLERWRGDRRAGALDSFFSGQVEQARRQSGHRGVYLGSETRNLVVGIPCPSLAFEFVIAQDCFPLGLVLQLVAKPGIGKSAMCAEFGRWFDLAGGGMVLTEAETKFNPLWYRSIMGSSVYDRRVHLRRADSVEGWQEHMTAGITLMKQWCIGTAEDPGPGRSVPALFAVDSIMGKQARETQEKIFGKEDAQGRHGKGGVGHAQRSYAIEAQIISKYMRTVPQMIDAWPFSIVLVNHLRIKTDDMGNAERYKTGGEQVNFQESFELELKKIGGHKHMIECTDFDGYTVQISCEKNSFGPTHRRIRSRILWWEEQTEDTGEWEQTTVWDWNWSLVDLLNTIMNGDAAKNVRLRAALKEIDFHVDCPSVSEVNNRGWSRSLGMKAGDAMPWSELGAMIQADKALADVLRQALRINRRPPMKGDYLAQLNAQAEGMP